MILVACVLFLLNSDSLIQRDERDERERGEKEQSTFLLWLCVHESASICSTNSFFFALYRQKKWKYYVLKQMNSLI